jgi:thymidylate synthase
MFLGVPFNIASYAFLLHIIANLTGYIPGRLIHILGDTHIYEEHLEAVNEQLSRVPVEFPQLIIKDPTGEQGVLRRLAPILNIDSLNEDMFEMRDYKSYDKISAPMIA